MLTSSESNYQIGDVTRLTGVSVYTLRMWEHRYKVVEPRRTETGRRLYSDADVERLRLIKQLVNSGNAISSVAHLSPDELRRRLSAEHSASTHTAGETILEPKLVVIGQVLAARLAEASLHRFEIVATLPFAEYPEQYVSMLQALAEPIQADIVVIDIPMLRSINSTIINRLMELAGAQYTILVYGFASTKELQRITTSSVLALRGPVSPADLHQACRSFARAPRTTTKGVDPLPSPSLAQGLPARKFTQEELAAVSVASTTLECECPHHLVDLIVTLSSFETYSSECSVRSPADAALHVDLHRTTAQARAMIEAALERLLVAEGIELPTSNKHDR